MDGGYGFIGVVRALESTLVRSLDLAPIALPGEVASLDGDWKGEKATLVARAYEGPRIQFARVVEIQAGQVEIANLLVLAEPALRVPVLGVDLVALRPDAGLAVADLSPVVANADEREAQIATIASRVNALPSLPTAGELPEWARAWFSPHPLFARVAPQDMPVVRAWLDTLCAVFIEMTLESVPYSPEAADRVDANQRAYCRAHLDDDRGLQMMMRMFDPLRARRVLTEIMFPVDRGARP